MAPYKHIDISPRYLPVDLSRQLLPGTFEYALNHLFFSLGPLQPVVNFHPAIGSQAFEAAPHKLKSAL